MTFLKILLTLFFTSNNADFIKKDLFYEAISSNNEIKIDKLLTTLETSNKSNLNQAYIASLKMKKSDFETILKIKISIFKDGANTLDSLILKSSNHLEMRFLRLIIQENAPKILKYNTSIQKDKEYIINFYKDQKNDLQKHILQYAKNSQIINEADLVL